MSEDHVDLASLRLLNESAIHDFALECSRRFRAGRFTRVGQEFVNEVKADVEAQIRALRNAGGSTEPHEPLAADDFCFTTGVLADRVTAEWNRNIAKLIQRKVQRQPSVGKTLSATR